VSWFDRNRHWILLALVAVTTVLAVGTVGVGLLSVLAGLASGAGIGAVLGDAALVLLIAATLVAADLAFAIAFLVTVTRRVSGPALPSLPESERLSNALDRAERTFPSLARFGLSDRLALSAETKRERLKQRYVNDELTQIEYERKLDALLADESDTDVDRSTVDNLDAGPAAGGDDETATTDERETDRRHTEPERG